MGNAAGGTVSITALEGVELSGTTADNPGDRRRSVTSISTDNRGTGTVPGELTLDTAQLTLRNGARISASTIAGAGGNIHINATDRVELIGTGISTGGLRSSGISVQTRGAGKAGDVNITTQQLSLSGGAEVSASTFASGDGGSVNIEAAEGVDLTGTAASDESVRSRLSAKVGNLQDVIRRRANAAPPATGQGGDVNVTTRQLTVQAGAAITASSRSRVGRAGRLNITANAIALDQGRLTTETSVGNGAVITLNDLDSLLLQNNSLISAQAFANATGGNVTVNAPDGFIVATQGQNSDIIASASQGNGGRITITTQGIFGIGQQRSLPQNQTNDIDASSQFSQSGTVTINEPDVDPSRGLVQLPANVVDRSNQIARGCSSKNTDSSRFVATGRGGLPLSPDEALRDRSLLAPEWVSLGAATGDRATTAPQSQTENSPENPIVEANGFSRDANGKTILVAQVHSTEAIGLGTQQNWCDRP